MLNLGRATAAGVSDEPAPIDRRLEGDPCFCMCVFAAREVARARLAS